MWLTLLVRSSAQKVVCCRPLHVATTNTGLRAEDSGPRVVEANVRTHHSCEIVSAQRAGPLQSSLPSLRLILLTETGLRDSMKRAAEP